VERRPEGPLATSLVARTDKKTAVHSRLIWAAAWTPDGQYFATASRDRRVVLWGQVGAAWGPAGPALTLPDSVTAVALTAGPRSGTYTAACGLESGALALADWGPEGGWGPARVWPLHLATVTRLAFRPAGGGGLLLASCSADTTVRLSTIIL
jgi:elongator complex protein 2